MVSDTDLQELAPPQVPTWFDRLTAALVSAMLGIGAVGALLAAVGWFQPATTVVLGLAVGYSLFSLREGFEQPDAWSWSSGAPAVAAVVVAVAAAVFIAVYPAEPVLAGPTAATIHIDAAALRSSGEAGFGPIEPEWGDAPVTLAGPGYEANAGGGLDSTGPPFSAALAGTVIWIGPDTASRIGAVTAAIALMAFYGYAARLLRPWTAAVFTVALAVNPALVHLARDASPALAALAFIFAGLAVLWDDTERWRLRRGLLGGLLVGAAAVAGIEWLLVALPAFAWLVHELRTGRNLQWTSRRRYRRYLGAFAAGYVVATLVALLVTASAAAGYGDGSGVAPGWVLAGLVLSGAVGAALPVRNDSTTRSRGPALAAAVLVLVGGAYFGLVRPLTTEATGSASAVVAVLQESQGLEVEPTRTYAEESALWQGWYLGPVAAVAGLLGWAMLAAATVLDRDGRRRPVLFLFFGASLLWLLRPGVDPVHSAVMGRFLPLTTAGLLLGAGWLALELWRRPGRLTELYQLGAIVVAAGSILFPLWYLTDGYDLATERGARDSVAVLCDALGDDAAVVVVGSGEAAERLPVSVRTWCDVPAVAEQSRIRFAEMAQLARDWSDSGRRLVVLSESDRPYAAARAPTPEVLPAFAATSLERRVDDRPRSASDTVITLYLSDLGGDAE